MKQSLKRPMKTSRVISSSRNTPNVEIQQHFKYNRKITPIPEIEVMPFVLNSDESPTNSSVRSKVSKLRTKKPKTTLNSARSTRSNLSDMSGFSLDKKVELLNEKISEIENEIASSFRSQSNFLELVHNSPALTEDFDSEKSFYFDKLESDKIINVPNLTSPRDFTKTQSKIPKSIVEPISLVDLKQFDMPAISKDDPSYLLRNEIAQYRKNLKKDVLPERIERLLNEKRKMNVSVQYEEQFDAGNSQENEEKEEQFIPVSENLR